MHFQEVPVMLPRAYAQGVKQSVPLKLYVSFIRPHLEYGAASWGPFLMKVVEPIKDVQKVFPKSMLA